MLSPRAREILVRVNRLKTMTVADAASEDLDLVDRVILDRMQQEDEAQLLRDLGGRAAEKQVSRDADAQALASGEKSRAQLKAENGAFAFPRNRIRLERPKNAAR